MDIDSTLRLIALETTGFMPPAEGDALYAAACAVEVVKPGQVFVEIGSYCGRSTVWLGAAARVKNTTLYAVDHHGGSQENQPGWEWHDPSLVDPSTGLLNTLPHFENTISRAGLQDVVCTVVGDSPQIAASWSKPIAFLFIDGGHGATVARNDYVGWSKHVVAGGVLAIHDVFTDPQDGGQAPYEQIYLPALASGLFVDVSATGSLRVLRRD